MNERKQLYQSLAQKWAKEAERLGARSRLISNLRGLCFGSALIAAVAAIAGADAGLYVPIALALLAAFFGFVVAHGRVIDAFDLAERWVDVNRDAESRLEHRWDNLPDTGEGLASPEHVYAADLDVFGRGSLFQRLCVARTRFGRERLAELLLQPAELPEIARRQSAVRALGDQLELRQRFEAHALGMLRAGRKGTASARVRSAPNPAPLLAWAESEPELLTDRLTVWGSRLLPPLTLAAFVARYAFGRPALPIAICVVLQLVVLVRSLRATQRAFRAVSVTEGAFLRYGTLLEIIEQHTTSDPLLVELKQRLDTQAGAPSLAMTRFRRLVGWFDLRHNPLVHPFVNLLLLWDVHCTLALERWQRATGKHLRDWFEVIGWFEALASLAAFAADEPGATYPELSPGPALFQAEGLCHPLIHADRRVANDVLLPAPGNALLVTGSNMSGKSTLLRAMGVSTVLALTGGGTAPARVAPRGAHQHPRRRFTRTRSESLLRRDRQAQDRGRCGQAAPPSAVLVGRDSARNELARAANRGSLGADRALTPRRHRRDFHTRRRTLPAAFGPDEPGRAGPPARKRRKRPYDLRLSCLPGARHRGKCAPADAPGGPGRTARIIRARCAEYYAKTGSTVVEGGRLVTLTLVSRSDYPEVFGTC
jgi:hypothetical protein